MSVITVGEEAAEFTGFEAIDNEEFETYAHLEPVEVRRAGSLNWLDRPRAGVPVTVRGDDQAIVRWVYGRRLTYFEGDLAKIAV